MSAEELVQKQIKEEYLIKGLLEKQGSLLIIGQTGIKKSMLTLHMALTLATRHKDNRLWGIFELPPKRIRTLFIQSENGISATQKRINLMVKSNPDLRNGMRRLFFPDGINDCRITGDLRTESFREKIKALIFKTKARLIVVDPLISFNYADENNNTEVRKVLNTLTEICDITKVACIVVHHMGKSSSNDVFSGRGASAIADWANDILILSKADKEGQKRIKINHAKSRNFIPALPFTLEAPDNLSFRRIESAAPEKDFQIVIDTLTELGGEVEDQGTFKEELVKCGVSSKSTALRLINKAVAAGLIEEDKNGRNIGYHLVKFERDQSCAG
jgi:KaiC/GvpD/RAD55 family RecA-like ATPase